VVLKKPSSLIRFGEFAVTDAEEGTRMGSARFRVKTPDVMHELIEGEVIIINLVSGTYYSVRGSGAEIWELVQDAEDVSGEDIVEALSTVFECSRSELEGQVTQFLDDLLREGLVVEVESGEAPPMLQSSDNGRAPRPFEKPTLEEYTDMQDLVLIDPVHQVDDAGWPRQTDEPA
jgi:Coenzyme PQQ synthesis protein D (PqqD)